MQTQTRGSWAILDIDGELDLSTAPRLGERIRDLIDSGHSKIVLNLENVSFMDSTGLGVLVAGLKRAKERSGALSLVAPTRPVMRVLSITGLSGIFPIHDDVDAACAVE